MMQERKARRADAARRDVDNMLNVPLLRDEYERKERETLFYIASCMAPVR
jgi:hypothetical protein